MPERYNRNAQADVCASISTSQTGNLDARTHCEIARFRHGYKVVDIKKAGFSNPVAFPVGDHAKPAPPKYVWVELAGGEDAAVAAA